MFTVQHLLENLFFVQFTLNSCHSWQELDLWRPFIWDGRRSAAGNAGSGFALCSFFYSSVSYFPSCPSFPPSSSPFFSSFSPPLSHRQALKSQVGICTFPISCTCPHCHTEDCTLSQLMLIPVDGWLSEQHDRWSRKILGHTGICPERCICLRSGNLADIGLGRIEVEVENTLCWKYSRLVQ